VCLTLVYRKFHFRFILLNWQKSAKVSRPVNN